MIYISSACVKAEKISESVRILAQEGFQNIELSGGTTYYPEYLEDLKALRSEFGLNYLIHNYFPPPIKDFVINLASCDKAHSKMSLNHCKNAIDVSRDLGLDKFSFHAGFLINIPLSEIGQSIQKTTLFPRDESMEVFVENLQELYAYAKDDVKLYVENNVLSEGNYNRFNRSNPFFLTSLMDYQNLLEKINVNLLLDFAHLKVSANSLGNNFEEEALQLVTKTDYIHLSDNNGKVDSNKGILKDSEMHRILKKCSIENKTVSLEIYDGMEQLKQSHDLIHQLN